VVQPRSGVAVPDDSGQASPAHHSPVAGLQARQDASAVVGRRILVPLMALLCRREGGPHDAVAGRCLWKVFWPSCWMEKRAQAPWDAWRGVGTGRQDRTTEGAGRREGLVAIPQSGGNWGGGEATLETHVAGYWAGSTGLGTVGAELRRQSRQSRNTTERQSVSLFNSGGERARRFVVLSAGRAVRKVP